MDKLNIYLAGAMDYYRDKGNFEDKAVKWRHRFQIEAHRLLGLNVLLFDPTLFPINDYPHDVISQNHHFIKKSDLIVVNLENINESLGTIWEMATAYNYDKPIITIGEHKWLEHPHMIKMSNYNAKDVESAAKFIYDAYGV